VVRLGVIWLFVLWGRSRTRFWRGTVFGCIQAKEGVELGLNIGFSAGDGKRVQRVNPQTKK